MSTVFGIFSVGICLTIIVFIAWLSWPRRPNPREVRDLPDGTTGWATDTPRRLWAEPSTQGTDHPYPPDMSGGIYSEWDGTVYGWFFTLFINLAIGVLIPLFTVVALAFITN